MGCLLLEDFSKQLGNCNMLVVGLKSSIFIFEGCDLYKIYSKFNIHRIWRNIQWIFLLIASIYVFPFFLLNLKATSEPISFPVLHAFMSGEGYFPSDKPYALFSFYKIY